MKLTFILFYEKEEAGYLVGLTPEWVHWDVDKNYKPTREPVVFSNQSDRRATGLGNAKLVAEGDCAWSSTIINWLTEQSLEVLFSLTYFRISWILMARYRRHSQNWGLLDWWYSRRLKQINLTSIYFDRLEEAGYLVDLVRLFIAANFPFGKLERASEMCLEKASMTFPWLNWDCSIGMIFYSMLSRKIVIVYSLMEGDHDTITDRFLTSLPRLMNPLSF